MTRPCQSMLALVLIALLCGGVPIAPGQTPLSTAFTYQGQLKQLGQPLSGTADIEFSLWDAVTGGQQVGSTQTVSNVSVNQGLFTASLDFGASPFAGNDRWVQLAVRSPAGSGAFTALSPRQMLAPAPYAIFSAAPWITAGGNLAYTGGNVGIGTMSPQAPLHVAASNGPGVNLPGLKTEQNDTSPNLIAGFSGNSVYPGSFGIAIGGGGSSVHPNSAKGAYGVVGGGESNRAEEWWTSVGGGYGNTAFGQYSTIVGGLLAEAHGYASTVAGGYRNRTHGQYSLAAGFRAVTDHDGSFVWADMDPTETDFVSTGPNQFLIRARGGVGINTNAPQAALDVNGAVSASAFRLNGATITSWPSFPIGGIIMWSGSLASIPSGWALCDGSNGTPDLRDRFVVGAGNSYAVSAVGGEARHTLTVSEMPAHTHDVVRGGGSSGQSAGDFGSSGYQDVPVVTSSTGGGQPHENRPPYYALAYVMKVAARDSTTAVGEMGGTPHETFRANDAEVAELRARLEKLESLVAQLGAGE